MKTTENQIKEIYVIQGGVSYSEDTYNLSFVIDEEEAIKLVDKLNKNNPHGDYGYEGLGINTEIVDTAKREKLLARLNLSDEEKRILGV